MRFFNKTKFITLLFVFLSAVLFMARVPTYAATTPSLGQAASFGILSDTYTNTVSGTTLNGDLGYTTGPVVAPTVNGTTHVADSTYNQAGTDQGSALSALNSQPCDFNFGSPTDLSLLSQPLAPGVYCVTAATSIGTGGITLNGAGTYIFRIDGALSTVANSNVTLAGGATVCDVFWTPTAATTLGANTTFFGTVIDASGITIGSTVTWSGRALAFGGTVSTDTDTITVPTCAVTPSPTPTSIFTPTPTTPSTSAPTSPPTASSTNGGDGRSDGLSDGRSDGMSVGPSGESSIGGEQAANPLIPGFPNTGNPRLPNTGIGPQENNTGLGILIVSLIVSTFIYINYKFKFLGRKS